MKRKIFSILFALVLVASFSLVAVLPAMAHPGTIQVDVNDPACVTGPQPDLYSVVYCSIQDAIDDATAGDTISVAAGTYDEQVSIDKNELTLQSTQGRDVTIIDAGGDDAPQYVNYAILIDGATGVTIDGFILQNVSELGDIEQQCFGLKGKNGDDEITAKNIIIKGVRDSTNPDNNKQGYAVQVDGRIDILNMIVEDCDHGISIARWNSDGSTVKNVIARNNGHGAPDNPGGFDLWIDWMDVTVENFTAESDLADGTDISMYITGRVRVATIRNFVSHSETEIGIQILGGFPHAGTFFHIIDSEVTHKTDSAISMSCSEPPYYTDYDVEIAGTTLTDNSIGIDIGMDLAGYAGHNTWGPPSGEVTITGCDIHDNDIGIIRRGQVDRGTVKINSSNIYDDNQYGIKNELSSEIDATNNWWGDASGPTHTTNTGGSGDVISDNVKYSPWWGASYLTGVPPNMTLVPHPWTWHVNTTGGSSPGAIQEGIDVATAGDTIIVHAGTYDEQVVINKNLTLEGAGDTTIVKPSSKDKLTTIVGGVVGPYYPHRGEGYKQIASIIVANDAANVTVKNLKVDGVSVTGLPAHDPAVYALVGILYCESGGTIDNVTVDNLMGAKSISVYLSATSETVSVEVKNSTLTNWKKNCLDACGDHLTVDIHDNIMTGQGAGYEPEVQNGVVVAIGTEATVNDNAISNMSYPGIPWTSIAIMFHSSHGEANNNTITDVQVGVWAEDSNLSAEGNTITLTGAQTGCSGLETRLYGELGLYGGGMGFRDGDWTVSFVNNTVTGTWEQGVGIGSKKEALATSSLTVTLDGNHLTGSGSGVEYPYNKGYGIYIGDNEGHGEDTVAPIIVSVVNNDISDWMHGIYISDHSTLDPITATITGNTIQNNAGAVDSGIHIESDIDATKVQMHLNNIVGNTGTGVYGVYNGGTGTLDATNNWWGDASGPSGGVADPVTSTLANGTGDAVSANVHFDPWIGAGVEESKTETVTGDGTMEDTPTGGDVSIDATGEHTITTAKYTKNPGGTPTFEATGDYYDVHLDDDTNVTSLTIEFCPADEDTVIYYWDETSWRRASNQSYDTATSCKIVTITDSTHPSLADLTGIPFASGTPYPPPPVGGEVYPINKAIVLAPWLGLALVVAIAGVILVMRWRKAN